MQDTWIYDRSTTADEVLQGRDLNGKVALVTGANSGIGYETARALAAAGAHVILACRNAELGQQAVAAITRAHAQAKVELVSLDLASPSSVRGCASSIDERDDISQLDILICNAGSMSMKYVMTDEGIERTVAVCHLGHFLLTQGLMGKLLKAAAPRVVMVSSESHRFPRTLDFDNLLQAKRKNTITAFNAYGQAKLCNALMALELQQRYGDQGLIACAVHPGNLVTTRFGQGSWFTKLAFALASPLTKTPAQGAATSVMCATHPSAKAIAGQYFSHCRPARPTPEARNLDVAKRLWEFSEHCVASSAA